MSLQLPDPAAKYRPSPFWSWNADLKPEELRWQIRKMHEAGLGGFFMHARGGLQTAYLSKEWMQCVEASLDEAGILGMDAWLYDENGWPSGFGGGLVNGLGVDYQAKYLRKEIIDAQAAAKKENTIAFFSENGSVYYGDSLPEDISGNVMRCYFDVNPYYVDNLDRKVVAEFIRVTHQHYYENIPPQLLKHLRGIFTDEPQLSRDGTPWSFILEEEYKKEYACELRPLLSALFTDLPESSQTRIRFWKLCSKLFAEAFMKQIGDWCKAHNWELTGHHVLEESFAYQTSANGSMMPQYRYYTLPGVDHLCRRDSSDMASVQLLSVGQQYGLKQLLTESFALSGWACNFTGMRWLYQRQLANGINYLCQHLESYSLRGRRKRDYPQSSFYHQPWWEDYKLLNDYFSKVGMLLAEGSVKAPVLVVHPISSMWKRFTGTYPADILNCIYQQGLEKLTKELNARFIQHHYADEIIVDECGSVDNGIFTVGQASYEMVLIPRLTNISRKIFELLKKFRRQGGKIAVIKESVRMGKFTIDGIEADAEELDFFNTLPAFDSETSIAMYAENNVEKWVEVTENGVPTTMIAGTWRDIEISGIKGRFYYLVNNNYRSGAKTKITLPFTDKAVAVIDQLDGTFRKINTLSKENGKTVFNCNFGSADALMLFVSDRMTTDFLPEMNRFDCDAQAVRILPERAWQIAKISDNILTLDRCRYRVDGGKWDEADAIDVQTRLLDLERSCDLELEFDFFTDEDFDFTRPVDLAVEEPEKFKFTLNGVSFEPEKKGYLFDKAFERITLPVNLKQGKNTIGMKTRFEQDPETYETIRKARIFESEYNKLTFNTEIESIYLCGEFSVRHNGDVVSLANDASRLKGNFSLGSPLKCERVNCSKLITEGMPFFAGKLTLRNGFTLTSEELKNINFLSFDIKGANSVKVKINGIDCGGAYWEPFAVPVRHALQTGMNTIELELVISLRNMLGPHHLQVGESFNVSTLSFNREPTLIRNEPPLSTPEFCMLDFGIANLKFTR